MDLLQNFLFAFLFSFLGSIPPGTLNLTVLQLGIEKKMSIAWRFAVTTALIEYPYAWVAVMFEGLIASSQVILDNFKLVSAVIMIILGTLHLWAVQRPTVITRKFQESGFRRGFLLSILNPMVLPFWIAITAYLKAQGWITLSTTKQLHGYLLGISFGAFALLILIAYLSKRMVVAYQPGSKIKLIPGIVLLALGIYAFMDYLF